MISANNKFAIGEECYTYYRKVMRIKCPLCNGNKKILYGDFEVRCRSCDSDGMINTKMTIVAPAKVKVTKVVVSVGEEEMRIKYKVRPDDWSINIRNRQEESLFKTLQEATDKCKEINLGAAGEF